MGKAPPTVKALAGEARIEPDEALIVLWDAGLESVTSPNDRVPVSDLAKARLALGVVKASELKRRRYWERVLQMSGAEFDAFALERGVKLGPRAKNLPKGAIAKLRGWQDVAASESGASVSSGKGPSPERPAAPPLEWRSVGHEREVRFLQAAEVESIHFVLVREFQDTPDPIAPPGVHVRDTLNSAVFRQETSLGGVGKYPTVEMAAAALLHAIVCDHPFINGNKRTGLVALLVMLYENGLRLTCSQDEIFRVVLQTAQHLLVPFADQLADREVLWLADWLRAHCERIEHGERVLTWLKLKRILARFNVTWEHPSVGNRIVLYRTHTWTTGILLKRHHSKSLSIRVAYHSDGTEVPRKTVAKIRQALHLDEREHGCDSAVFYEAKAEPEDFIVEYQRVLSRLAPF